MHTKLNFRIVLLTIITIFSAMSTDRHHSHHQSPACFYQK